MIIISKNDNDILIIIYNSKNSKLLTVIGTL